MGNKVQAKESMKGIGIPVIYGSDDIINNIYLSSSKSRRKKLSLYHQTIGKIYIEKTFGRIQALNNLIKSLFLNPILLTSWYNIILLMLPQSFIRTIKNSDK